MRIRVFFGRDVGHAEHGYGVNTEVPNQFFDTLSQDRRRTRH